MKRIIFLLTTIFTCTCSYAETINLHWLNDNGTTYTESTCTVDDDLIIPTTPPTKYGYTFTGWDLLPYISLEYIESTGTQYIDTGIYTSNEITAEYTFALTELPSGIGQIFGAGGNYPTDTQVWTEWGSFLVAKCGNSYCSCGAQDKNIHTVIFNNTDGNVLFDNNTRGSFLSYNSNRKVMFLGRSNHANVYPTKQKIYSAKFTNKTTGLIIADFIPVLDDAGTPCMYDLVEHKFYYNAGSGDFIAGPVLQ